MMKLMLSLISKVTNNALGTSLIKSIHQSIADAISIVSSGLSYGDRRTLPSKILHKYTLISGTQLRINVRIPENSTVRAVGCERMLFF